MTHHITFRDPANARTEMIGAAYFVRLNEEQRSRIRLGRDRDRWHIGKIKSVKPQPGEVVAEIKDDRTLRWIRRVMGMRVEGPEPFRFSSKIDAGLDAAKVVGTAFRHRDREAGRIVEYDPKTGRNVVEVTDPVAISFLKNTFRTAKIEASVGAVQEKKEIGLADINDALEAAARRKKR